MLKGKCPSLIIFLLVVIPQITLWASPCREVVGYYAAWKSQQRNQLVNPATLRYENYTIINYAFFKPDAQGSVHESRSGIDAIILNGDNKGQAGTSGKGLVWYAHKNSVKVIASVGGWTYSSAFPAIAANPALRKKFAAACVNLVRKYNLDGIDLDWEFPGYAPHGGSADDREGFTRLLHDLRTALDEFEIKAGHQLILTAAFGPAASHLENIDWKAVVPYLDLIHIMTYNYSGAWAKRTGHLAPLYSPLFKQWGGSVQETFDNLVYKLGVPPNKLTMGLPFYGRSVKTISDPALRATGTGTSDAVTFRAGKGAPSYYDIVNKADLFETHWDSIAMVPYMTGLNGLNTFISYENPRSIKEKTLYAVQLDIAGVMIWDIAGEYLFDNNKDSGALQTPLTDIINDVFCKSRNFVQFDRLGEGAGRE